MRSITCCPRDLAGALYLGTVSKIAALARSIKRVGAHDSEKYPRPCRCGYSQAMPSASPSNPWGSLPVDWNPLAETSSQSRSGGYSGMQAPL